MGLFDGCLLACDVDGTLMESGYINQKNIDAVNFFKKEGGSFSIATGRSVSAINMVLRVLGEISPCVLANGGMIYDYTQKKSLYEISLPKEEYHIVSKAIKFNKNIGVEIHSGNNVFLLNKTPEADLHAEYEEMSVTEAGFEDIKDLNWNKAIMIFPDEELFNQTIEFLSAFPVISRYVSTTAIIKDKKQNYYEQLPDGISKATAISELCKILNIEKGKVFAIGDYYNDLEMLKNADISAAVIDSPEDVKNQVDFIAGSCRDGAVSDFIEYLTNLRKES